MSKTDFKGAMLAALCVPVVLVTLCAPSAAMTVDELTAVQREVQASELRKKVESAKPAAPAETAPAAIAEPQKKRDVPVSEAQLVAIYGVGTDLVAEISYDGSIIKVVKGGTVIDGWNISSISSSEVVITKVGKLKKNPSVTLRFTVPASAPASEPAAVAERTPATGSFGAPAPMMPQMPFGPSANLPRSALPSTR